MALDSRLKQLEMLGKSLRRSEQLLDMIYCYRYFDRVKVREISQRLNYSEMQIYRYLKQIRTEINTLKDVSKC